MPEDGERATVLRGPVQEFHELRLRALRRQAEVALFRERRIHCGERNLDEVEWLVSFEVPRAERTRNAGPEADSVRKAERRVVAETGGRERREVSVRIRAKVVIAMAGDRAGERLELLLLRSEADRIVSRGVAAVQADLGADAQERLDELWPKAAVFLRRASVVRVVVACDHVEGRAACTAAAFLRDDLLEPPVRIGATHAMQRCSRETRRFTHCWPETCMTDVLLQPRSRAAQADPRPAPGRVDVVRQRNGEAWTAGGRNTQPAAQPLERRVERVETRPLGAKAAVLITRARILLLDTRQMEEALGQVVALWTFPALHSLPGVGVVRHVVAEADVRCADRIQHPAGTPLDRGGNHRSALRTTRARWTAAGFGSSRAKTAST